MEKKNNLNRKNPQPEIDSEQLKTNPDQNSVEESLIEYGIPEEIKILPLTEKDLKNCITTEELLESVYAHIDKLFDNRK